MAGDALEMATVKRALTGIDAVIQSLGVSAGPEIILKPTRLLKAYRALVNPRDWTCGFISRANVADFLVRQIDNDSFVHKTPVLTS